MEITTHLWRGHGATNCPEIISKSNSYLFYNIMKTQGHERIQKLEFYNFYEMFEVIPGLSSRRM
jgi:hypothetical protein